MASEGGGGAVGGGWEAFRERSHLNDALKGGSYDRQSWGSGSILPGDPTYRITPLAGLGGGAGGG